VFLALASGRATFEESAPPSTYANGRRLPRAMPLSARRRARGPGSHILEAKLSTNFGRASWARRAHIMRATRPARTVAREREPRVAACRARPTATRPDRATRRALCGPRRAARGTFVAPKRGRPSKERTMMTSTRARAANDALMRIAALGWPSVCLLPACLSLEIGFWDACSDDDDEQPQEVPAEVLQCCEDHADTHRAVIVCVQDAREGLGPCASDDGRYERAAPIAPARSVVQEGDAR